MIWGVNCPNMVFMLFMFMVALLGGIAVAVLVVPVALVETEVAALDSSSVPP